MVQGLTNDQLLMDIHKNALLEDPGLIVLQQAVLLCERKNVCEIRYSDLRKECNIKLNELTNGVQPVFGGSFENHIKRFSDTSLLPDKRFFNRVKIAPKKTIIIPNIPMIKGFPSNKRIDPFNS